MLFVLNFVDCYEFVKRSFRRTEEDLQHYELFKLSQSYLSKELIVELIESLNLIKD